MKNKKEMKKKEEITYRAKEWTDKNEGCRNWIDRSLTNMTDVLWQCVSAKSREIRGKGSGFYRKTKDETTLRSEIKTNQKTTCVMRHKCFRTTCQTFVYLMTSAFPTVIPLTLSPSTPSFQPSTHEHWIVSL